jgi:hypothetical protein
MAKESKLLKESSKKIEGEFYDAIAHRNKVQGDFNTKNSIISKLELELAQMKKEHQVTIQRMGKQSKNEFENMEKQ